MAHGDITHLDIPADDISRARQFYGTVFGWDIQEYPGFEDYPMWQGPNKVSGGGIAPRVGGLVHPRSYVEVDSIDGSLAAIEANGGRTLTAKTPITATSWFAAFEDTEGNQLGLYEGVTSTD